MRTGQENLELLLEVSLLLSSKLDLGELLEAIIKLSARVVNAETASLLLVDPKTQELYFDVALGLAPEVASKRLKLGEGIAGGCAKSGKSAIINDVRKDPRWSPSVDQSSGFQTRSILATPLKIKGKVIGVVEAINPLDGDFTEAELPIFEAFSSQAAIAIENARLFSALKEEKARLSTVFTEMDDGAVLTDGTGGVLFANDAAAKAFAVGSQLTGRLQDAAAGFAVTPAFETMLLSHDATMRFEAVRKEPKLLILAGTASLVPLEQLGSKQGSSGRLFVFRDVTEQKREEALTRSFLSLISHKLKTPLASITGYAQLLIQDFGPQLPPMALKSAKTIAAQGSRLAEHVEKLLNFTVLEDMSADAARFEAVPIDTLIHDAAESMKSWLEERQAKVVHETKSDLTVWADPSMLRDVLKNLIENSVKFSTTDKKVAVWAESQDGSVVVHVKDRGAGIPPEEQDKIFDKFYQVESDFTGQVEGWGLGLAFVKKVIERHGGNIRLQSKLGSGTTVSVCLPRPKG